MPLQATSGAASYDAFGGGVAAVPQYIEDVFSTWLYKGNSSTQTINNGVDLAGKGGMVWLKVRDAGGDNYIRDTARGGTKLLKTNSTAAQDTTDAYPDGNGLRFDTTGFSLGPGGAQNSSSFNYASWTFRKAPKFFDVVTYTGNGTAGRQIAHSLGSTPGFLVVKRTDSTSNWSTWHTSIPNAYMSLDTTNPQNTDNGVLWGNGSTHIDPTSTVFTVSSNAQVNASGGTYVAYLFAHNAGGFGLTGTDNVISCGSFTTDGSGNIPATTLGYEPQWMLVKPSSGTGNWIIFDNMRGLALSTNGQAILYPNTSGAEGTASPAMYINATGFSSGAWWATSTQYIYIAIRRGPMKVPTDGTSVFTPTAYTGNGAGTRLINAGFPPDMFIPRVRTGSYGYNSWVVSRLQNGGQTMALNAQFQEQAYDTGSFTREQLGYVTRTSTNIANPADDSMIGYSIRRAPSFADVVCWQGNGSAADVNHNLGVKPQMILAKNRLNSSNWFVLVGGTGRFSTNYSDAAGFNLGGADCYGSTATTFSTTYVQDVSSNAPTTNNQLYVAYLFASAPGVSKVGSYTGTGATQTISCGFTGGARFVLIKRTDSTGDWYVWDTARGMVSGTDPSVLISSSTAETNANSVYTTTGGFQIVSTAAGINASGGTYIFLAIA